MKSDENLNDVSGSFFTKEDVVKFFDDRLSEFRQNLKDAKTSNEQEIYMRFCDAISYLKQMWIGKNDH